MPAVALLVRWMLVASSVIVMCSTADCFKIPEAANFKRRTCLPSKRGGLLIQQWRNAPCTRVGQHPSLKMGLNLPLFINLRKPLEIIVKKTPLAVRIGLVGAGIICVVVARELFKRTMKGGPCTGAEPNLRSHNQGIQKKSQLLSDNRIGVTECCSRCGSSRHSISACHASIHQDGSNLFTVYVLKLKKGKWYVGSTSNLSQRLEEHRKGAGSQWTRKYGYIQSVAPQTAYQAQFWELSETLMMMKKYGVENVRGSMFCQKGPLTHTKKREVFDLICEAESLCRRCGGADHFATQCKSKEVAPWVQVAIPRECASCGCSISSSKLSMFMCSTCYAASSRSNEKTTSSMAQLSLVHPRGLSQHGLPNDITKKQCERCQGCIMGAPVHHKLCLECWKSRRADYIPGYA